MNKLFRILKNCKVFQFSSLCSKHHPRVLCKKLFCKRKTDVYFFFFLLFITVFFLKRFTAQNTNAVQEDDPSALKRAIFPKIKSLQPSAGTPDFKIALAGSTKLLIKKKIGAANTHLDPFVGVFLFVENFYWIFFSRY